MRLHCTAIWAVRSLKDLGSLHFQTLPLPRLTLFPVRRSCLRVAFILLWPSWMTQTQPYSYRFRCRICSSLPDLSLVLELSDFWPIEAFVSSPSCFSPIELERISNRYSVLFKLVIQLLVPQTSKDNYWPAPRHCRIKHSSR